MPTLTVAECENPKARDARLQELDSDKGWQNSADAYNAQWQDYIDKRLAKLGMSQSEQAKFMADIAETKDFKDLQAKNQVILDKMSSDFSTLGDSHDEATACKTVAGMLSTLSPMIANADLQWKLIDKAIIAEAKRRKIKLDD